MTDKADFINSMVNVFEQYGDEYTIEQAMEHVADYCQKKFVEQACEAVDEVITNSKAPGFNNGYDHCKVKVKQAIRDKFK